MSFGLKFIEKISKKYREWVRLCGYIGVGAGYVGLVIISYSLIKNLIVLFTQPTAQSGVSLVLPGISVPGLGVLPFWYWILAIFLIALIHEFSHGIVARAHDIKVKNTGLVLFGPIIGAFVEPDEQQMRKQSDITQYSVLAAGSFSNILMAVVSILLLTWVLLPIQATMVEPVGFTFHEYYGEDFAFEQAGIEPGTIITGINGESTTNFRPFGDVLQCTKPGEEISLSTTSGDVPLTLGKDPTDESKSFLGIQTIENEVKVKEQYEGGLLGVFYAALVWLIGFLRWLFLLSLGIGLFNLLPLPIVDGGRMVQVALHKLSGTDKGERQYRMLALVTLMVLLLNLFYPLIAKIF